MKPAYEKEVWDNYAQAFLSVMPSCMLELNQYVASYAKGSVCDFGCGAAKIAPFVLDNLEVDSYTGIDYSMEMVEKARWHLAQFTGKPSCIIHGRIEKVNASGEALYDSALSINSFYAWEAPDVVLQSIYQVLHPGAVFILVTPNKQLNMARLLEKAKQELVAHPNFETFMKQNMALVGNEKALFIDMDELVGLVREVGFKLEQAHQNFYEGGLNFLYLRK